MLTVKLIIKKHWWLASLLSFLLVAAVPVYFSAFPIQTPIPNGTYIKNGSRVFYQFLNQVKDNKGVVILGTSETANSLGGFNYWNLLQKDSEVKTRFYDISGAGRNGHVYFPLILNNPQAFKDLNLIYYINPTYWRSSLNQFNPDYFQRYVNNGLALSVLPSAMELGIYDDFMKAGMNKRAVFYDGVKRWVEDVRSYYVYDFNQFFFTDEEKQRSNLFQLDSVYTKEKIQALRQKIDTAFNVTQEFKRKNVPFPKVDTSSTFQTDMLLAFIKLIKKYEINCTFYLGPYNAIYCEKKNPEHKKGYEELLKSLKKTLTEKDVNYIDGTYQSYLSGTFIDIQHISKYGAYLTAKDIKETYEKSK